jgi:outer membrane lipoprotein-sorting protein
MRKFLLILILLAPWLVVDAQKDVKAIEILEDVSKRVLSYKNISADFIFSMENKEMELDEENEGSLKMNGKKYVVDLPGIGVKVFSDGQTIWNYMKDGNQVTISNSADQDNELMDPASIFTIYEKGFHPKLKGESKEAGKLCYQIELIPENQESDISKVIVNIDKTEMMINSALFQSKDGNLYGIKIKKLETNLTLPDSYFVFNTNDYKDIEVIDFR